MNLMVGNTTMNGLKHHLRVEPYDYQREGIVYGLKHRRLIIGDEPGLGKTLQSIGIVDTANAYPCLVICPSSLKINWQREFEKFTDKSAVVLDNAVRTTWNYLLSMGVHQVAVVNYESLFGTSKRKVSSSVSKMLYSVLKYRCSNQSSSTKAIV